MLVFFFIRYHLKNSKNRIKMIFSSGFLRKSSVEINFYRRFLKKIVYRNLGFLVAISYKPTYSMSRLRLGT
jgi:hypothetical protein